MIKYWAEIAGATHGKRVVSTNGVFDVLHIGHIRCLQWAREQGDVLVVALNTDDWVTKHKGEGKPLNKLDDRAEALMALSCVDHVAAFSDDTPIHFLEELQPAVHVKGGDYMINAMPETIIVESYGGEVLISPTPIYECTFKPVAR
jgi:rfaE bifunctional protein nucleotidyltransferase chain/domain